MQAPGKSEQDLAPAGSAPARIAILWVGALSDDAVAFAPAHESAHTRCPADPRDDAHAFIVRTDEGSRSGADESGLK